MQNIPGINEFGPSSEDQRMFFECTLGDTITLPCVGGSSEELLGALEEGRYLVQVLDIGSERVWVRHGVHGSTVAAAAAPSFPMDALGVLAFEINVKRGNGMPNSIAVFCANAGPEIHVTRIGG